MLDRITSYVGYVFSSYGWTAFIELLLIGIVVYSVIRFLRGTGGEKLFQGIVILVVGFLLVSFLTEKLALERIVYLFQYFLMGVLAVAAIAFQPELRRGLMRLGGTRFSRTAEPEMVQVIEHVVDTVAVLSRTQIGALIAFEREVGLADLVAGGTQLDSDVSVELLHTIFWPGTPLHDMGVVIRQGRVTAAGVQFPLAEHGEYDRLLGSRHRAAIGLSATTDAVIVVVSEETGTIGLAVNGKLTRFLTLEQLRRQLLDLMMPLAQSRRGREQAAESAKKGTSPASGQRTSSEDTDTGDGGSGTGDVSDGGKEKEADMSAVDAAQGSHETSASSEELSQR